MVRPDEEEARGATSRRGSYVGEKYLSILEAMGDGEGVRDGGSGVGIEAHGGERAGVGDLVGTVSLTLGVSRRGEREREEGW